MLLLLIAPVFVAAALSMTDYSLGNSGFNWIGWENYEKLFSRRSYSKMFTASLTYVLLVVPISVALGLGSALLISSLRIGGELYKAIFFSSCYGHIACDGNRVGICAQPNRWRGK
jgi:multiple sugar transport system permease protein